MITTLDKNTALVLIDLQKGILQYPLPVPVSGVLQNAAKLIAAFRKAGLPVVIVNVNPALTKKVDIRKDAQQPARTYAPDFFEITPELKTEPADIFITKQTWNAFFETDLHEQLQKRSVTGIVLAGVATSIGVEATARSANEHGYNIAFAKDAMADMFTEAHEHSFKYIFPRLGEVGTTADIIARLLNGR